MTNLPTMPGHARDFFAAEYELRMKDIEVGHRVITKDAIEGTCVRRTINAASGWTCTEIEYDDGRLKTYFGHATKTLPVAYAEDN